MKPTKLQIPVDLIHMMDNYYASMSCFVFCVNHVAAASAAVYYRQKADQYLRQFWSIVDDLYPVNKGMAMSYNPNAMCVDLGLAEPDIALADKKLSIVHITVKCKIPMSAQSRLDRCEVLDAKIGKYARSTFGRRYAIDYAREHNDMMYHFWRIVDEFFKDQYDTSDMELVNGELMLTVYGTDPISPPGDE